MDWCLFEVSQMVSMLHATASSTELLSQPSGRFHEIPGLHSKSETPTCLQLKNLKFEFFSCTARPKVSPSFQCPYKCTAAAKA